MPKSIVISAARILVLEDDPHDRQLLEAALVDDGLSLQIVNAQTKEEFQAALEENQFDLILSDFNIPSYSG
ncbi:MAG TPA: response regulator, partial [Candidatus Baltobacteraceae bacterium]|nr:response regulator [Candidatus Baltobacteraceae bacterium]